MNSEERQKAIKEADEFINRENLCNVTSMTERHFRNLLNICKALIEESEWQPIETAPKIRQEILVTNCDCLEDYPDAIELVQTPFRKDGTILNLNSGNYSRPNVWTHWMPIPDPPKDVS